MGPFRIQSEWEIIGGFAFFGLIAIAVWLFKKGREHARCGSDHTDVTPHETEIRTSITKPRLAKAPPKLLVCGTCRDVHDTLLPCPTIVPPDSTKSDGSRANT